MIPGMDAVTVRPVTGEVAAVHPGDAPTAWLLDPVSLHREFEDLFAGLADAGGLDHFRDRVSAIWRSPDRLVHGYISSLPTHTPDDWAEGFEESYLGEWYRVLMAVHLRPTRSLRSPAAVKDRLPDLGWAPADARRLAWGRELAQLAERYAAPECGAALELVLPLGNKGWLSQDDAEEFLERFRTMPRAVFRDQQHLIPLVEEIFAVLQAATEHPDRVLLLAVT